MISFTHRGDFKKTTKFLSFIFHKDYSTILHKYGKKGVALLRQNTPRDTGLTADSWGYEIHSDRSRSTITWTNSNIQDGYSIAILLQYGHGTKNGGYVYGVDYINPTIREIFENMSGEIWEEVRNA